MTTKGTLGSHDLRLINGLPKDAIAWQKIKEVLSHSAQSPPMQKPPSAPRGCPAPPPAFGYCRPTGCSEQRQQLDGVRHGIQLRTIPQRGMASSESTVDTATQLDANSGLRSYFAARTAVVPPTGMAVKITETPILKSVARKA